MLEIIKAIIYGIVEGITEWLPISSTGHLILVERLIPFRRPVKASSICLMLSFSWELSWR